MATFIESALARASEHKRRIILPEVGDERILEAARIVADLKIAVPVLVGTEAQIKEAGSLRSGIETFAIDTDPDIPVMAEELARLRAHKGLTVEDARELLKNPVYVGTMLVKEKRADGMVAGAATATADVLRPVLQILKTAEGARLVSAFFLMETTNGTYLFADCALNEFPDAEQLAEIAVASARSWKNLMGTEPRVAMLSYSTRGSADSEQIRTVRSAVAKARDLDRSLLIDGEMQLDAAVDPGVASLKAADSPVAGKANVLVFPNIDAGNIGYKLLQRLGGASAYGPILQGIAAPVNDLSRGASVDDIVGVVAMTAMQAQ